MNEINATDFSRIEILEIKEIAVAVDVLEDETAVYPCTVKWRPVETTVTPNIKIAAGKINEGFVKILSLLKSAIKPGVYNLTSSNNYERAVA